MTPVEALREAVRLIGSQSATGRLLGISQHAVWQWLAREKPLPAKYVLPVSRETGIPPWVLNPEIYPRPDAPSSSDERLEGLRT